MLVDWQIQYLEDHKVVLAIVCGRVTAKSFKDFVKAATQKAAQKRFQNFLADAREVQLDLSVMEIYGLPALLPALGFLRTQHLAVLYDPRSPHAPDFGFLENILYNHGFSMRLFTDSDAALAWLKTQKTLPAETPAKLPSKPEEEREGA